MMICVLPLSKLSFFSDSFYKSKESGKTPSLCLYNIYYCQKYETIDEL